MGFTIDLKKGTITRRVDKLIADFIKPKVLDQSQYKDGELIQIKLSRSVWLGTGSRKVYGGQEEYWVDGHFESYTPGFIGEEFRRINVITPERSYGACHPDCVRRRI